ncbi:MAG: hypothetical protein U0807_04670 [Candidatus Binatia bacterium]
MRRSIVTPVLLLLSLSPVAHAADVKVSYLADAKAFKAAVAGTPLTFSLFTDASCSGTAAATQVVNAEATQVLEQLKRITPKGGTKAPATARIEHVLSGVMPVPTFYLQVTGTGVTPVGGACQLQTATVGGTTPPQPAVCAPDSVRAGAPCVDKYEASVWDIPAGNTVLIQKVKDGTATLADLTGGGATQIGATDGPPTYACTPSYPATFPWDGNYSAPLYAASIAGVKPSACITAFQAEVACELSGKRLLTNGEWVAAATGTPDTDTDNGTTDCNTNAPGAGVNAPVNTGSRSDVSRRPESPMPSAMCGNGRLAVSRRPGSAVATGTTARTRRSRWRTGTIRATPSATSASAAGGSRPARLSPVVRTLTRWPFATRDGERIPVMQRSYDLCAGIYEHVNRSRAQRGPHGGESAPPPREDAEALAGGGVAQTRVGADEVMPSGAIRHATSAAPS